MPLDMKESCEGCGMRLPVDGVGYICSFECTFCASCAGAMSYVCPNCRGELVPRPRRDNEVVLPRD